MIWATLGVVTAVVLAGAAARTQRNVAKARAERTLLVEW